MIPFLFPIAQASANPASPILSFLPILIVFGIFYFMLIAPMRKRQKALQAMVENLKRGDRVITNGGIYGEVAAIEGGTVQLKVADGVRLKVAKSAIAGMEGSPEAEKGIEK